MKRRAQHGDRLLIVEAAIVAAAIAIAALSALGVWLGYRA